MKKSKILYRKLLHDDCVKVYEELIEIFTDKIPNAEELARIELEMGDYFVTIQEYTKGVEYLESGKSRNLGESRVSLVEQYLPLAGVYIKEYGMYQKAAQIYKDCIGLYLSHSTTKYAATKVIFSYGLALIAYAVSNKDEPNEVNAQTKKANQGFAVDVNIDDLNTKLNDPVFKENDIDRLREGTFLASIVRALTESDKELFFRELGRNVTQLNTDQWQELCLLKIRKFFENEAEPSIL